MKKLIALMMAMLMLTGCQLASEEKKESKTDDKLVGVFITFDYLRGEFEIERWLAENPGAIEEEDVVLNFAESMDYSEKIPVLMGDQEWIVPGYEGLSMAHYHNGEYWTGFSTEGLCEVKSHLNAGDTADTIEEEATIFVPLDADVMCHMNPVYQTAAGEYYTIPAMGLGGAVSTGGMSQSLTEETVWKIDGEERSYSAKFTVAIKGTNLAETVTVVQMDAEHRELTRTEFIPGQMPESFPPETDTAYLIVEEHGAGETVRSLLQPGDQHIAVYYQGEKIWCLPDMMEILWSE